MSVIVGEVGQEKYRSGEDATEDSLFGELGAVSKLPSTLSVFSVPGGIKSGGGEAIDLCTPAELDNKCTLKTDPL